MRRLAVAALALLALPLLLTCGRDGSGTGPDTPDPGPVEVRLSTPSTDDGIVRIVVTGGAVAGVSAASYEVTSASLGADSTVILVRGDLASGIVAEITVPDRGALSSYTARVTQAASRINYVLQDVSGYQVTLTRP